MSNRISIKCQVREHRFHAQFKKNFEEDHWCWLKFNKLCDITYCFARVNTLKSHQFSESRFVNFDFVNVVEIGFVIVLFIFVLVLDTYLSIVIELASEVYMISWLYTQIIASTKWVYQSLLSIKVRDVPLPFTS